MAGLLGRVEDLLDAGLMARVAPGLEEAPHRVDVQHALQRKSDFGSEHLGERKIEDLLDPQSDDVDEWEVLVRSLADAVLWDEDWKDSESLLDADPKTSLAVKKLLGIDEDYYVAVPPDPTDEEMEGVWATLRGLTKGGL
jgi:hypothetical protein